MCSSCLSAADIIRSYYTYNHGFFPRGDNGNCWFRDMWIPSWCFQITTFHYPGGWHFSGLWAWTGLNVRVLDLNGDGKDDIVNLGGFTYNHQFIAV